ncbi:glycosyltransferase family 2 protein [Brevibacillus fluminis]|uniref:glycosyltransferase family 2 protein n=1 Tax=Brevibacillus fluminis TaxID=511487 RepID=UPI003F88D5B2
MPSPADRTKTVSIIIPVCNEAATLPAVLASCASLQPFEIIVVANGCTDGTEEIARRFGCTLISDPEPLGNDVGRAVGAAAAKGDILLFLDADFAIAADTLAAFLAPLHQGAADVVLNDFNAFFHKKHCPHTITVWRQVFNEILGRQDLVIDCILSVPHAMTREALAQIGVQSLANPLLAQALLMKSPLRIAHEMSIDVITPNRFRPLEHGHTEPGLPRAEKRMIGDHVAALAAVLEDPRGGFMDGGRRRDLMQRLAAGLDDIPVTSAGWGVTSSLYHGKQLSVIIPVQNEQKTIGEVIRQARKIEPLEIIVVVNGSTDATAQIASSLGAKTVVYPDALGNDVGRAVGAKMAQGEILLFLDGDFALPPKDLFPFCHAIATGTDIALNDLDYYLNLRFPLHIVTALKYAVNLALDRKDLGVGSMVAVPHALSRRAVDTIGWLPLLSPTMAQVKGTLAGLYVRNVHRVDVDLLNRIRPDQHFSSAGYAPAVARIIGDHVEGISQLIAERGERGGLYDGNRNWERVRDLRM